MIQDISKVIIGFKEMFFNLKFEKKSFKNSTENKIKDEKIFEKGDFPRYSYFPENNNYLLLTVCENIHFDKKMPFNINCQYKML